MPPSFITYLKDKYQRFHDWLQHHTRTDTRYLMHSSFWVTLSYAIQVLSGLMTTIVLAHQLTKEDLGIYQFILSTAGIVSAFTLSGLGTALIRGVARGNDGLLRTAVRTKLLWSTTITVLAGGIAAYYGYRGVYELSFAFLVVGACAPFIESFKLYENFLQGKEQFRDSVVLGAWRKPLPLIALIITAFLWPEPVALITIYFLANVLSYGLVYQTVLRKYKPGISHDDTTFTLGMHLSVSAFIGRVANQADKLIIYHLLGPVALASYSIAQLGSRYSGGFITSTTSLILPKLSKQNLVVLQTTLPRKVRLFSLVMATGIAAYILTVPIVFPILFPAYPESVAYSQVLMLSFLFVPRSVYGKALIAHNQVRAQYILTIMNPLINITLIVLLIPLYGIWGAVYANLIGGGVGAAISYTLFKKAV